MCSKSGDRRQGAGQARGNDLARHGSIAEFIGGIRGAQGGGEMGKKIKQGLRDV
jgi:hypothetical protein